MLDRGFRSAGLTLIELTLALALSLITVAAVYSVYVMQVRHTTGQRDILAMQQEVRAVLDLMVRELRMAGYDPAHVNRDSNPANDFSGVRGTSDQLVIRADLNGDGRPDDANEYVTFSHDPRTATLRRDTGGGKQPLGDHIESFSVTFLDRAGRPTTVPMQVRQVRLTLTGRTEKPNPRYPRNNGYRTYTLETSVVPRNLGF